MTYPFLGARTCGPHRAAGPALPRLVASHPTPSASMRTTGPRSQEGCNAIALLVLLAACAAPRIPVAPPITALEPSLQGPVLKPCVLLSQRFPQSKSDVVDGGAGMTEMIYASVVVDHPRFGLIVIDPAVGRDRLKDFGANPWLVRGALGDGSKTVPLFDLLTGAGIDPNAVNYALVTHFHFDHVGGGPDIPKAKFIISGADVSFASTGKVFGYPIIPPHEVRRIQDRIEPFTTSWPPYEGFAGSYDVFGDGSIVGVPTPGHTPGSTSWFVNSADGQRWLFIGDAAWSNDGYRLPAHKGFAGRFLDAENGGETGETLAALHAYHLARPNVHILAAHDPEMLSVLPTCGKATP
jgi:N-acyl homoserine lactone hydrolase